MPRHLPVPGDVPDEPLPLVVRPPAPQVVGAGLQRLDQGAPVAPRLLEARSPAAHLGQRGGQPAARHRERLEVAGGSDRCRRGSIACRDTATISTSWCAAGQLDRHVDSGQPGARPAAPGRPGRPGRRGRAPTGRGRTPYRGRDRPAGPGAAGCRGPARRRPRPSGHPRPARPRSRRDPPRGSPPRRGAGSPARPAGPRGARAGRPGTGRRRVAAGTSRATPPSPRPRHQRTRSPGSSSSALIRPA